MSRYAENLRSSANTWASAYIQFQTGHQREGYQGYAFVEDDDDKSFYQLALSDLDAICYLGCGGKDGVFAIFKKLLTEEKANGQLFFVDRDTEREPYSYGEDILRTASYSWESHVCEIAYVGWFLQRKIEPNLTPSQVVAVKESWLKTVQSFAPVLSKHTALCRTAAKLQVSFGMSKVVFTADPEISDMILSPSPTTLSWHTEKVQLAIKYGASLDDLHRREQFYLTEDPFRATKGKALFMLLRVFTKAVLTHFGRECRSQFNSAKAWIEAMPWNNASLEYIREYAAARLTHGV